MNSEMFESTLFLPLTDDLRGHFINLITTIIDIADELDDLINIIFIVKL